MFSDFIEETRSEPFRWGVNDCALWCASAVQSVTGIDPAADLRSTYSSRFECHQIIKNAGGLTAVVSPRMDRVGLRELEENQDGVAILQLRQKRLCGLIVDGRAVVRMETGLRIVDQYTIVRGWSCRKH